MYVWKYVNNVVCLYVLYVCVITPLTCRKALCFSIALQKSVTTLFCTFITLIYNIQKMCVCVGGGEQTKNTKNLEVCVVEHVAYEVQVDEKSLHRFRNWIRIINGK